MTITLQLSPDVELQLREGAARRDVEIVRRILTDAVTPTVDATVRALLQDPSVSSIPPQGSLTDAEFESLADELADMKPSLPSLSDEAVSREGLYSDHL